MDEESPGRFRAILAGALALLVVLGIAVHRSVGTAPNPARAALAVDSSAVAVPDITAPPRADGVVATVFGCREHGRITFSDRPCPSQSAAAASPSHGAPASSGVAHGTH